MTKLSECTDQPLTNDKPIMCQTRYTRTDACQQYSFYLLYKSQYICLLAGLRSVLPLAPSVSCNLKEQLAVRQDGTKDRFMRSYTRFPHKMFPCLRSSMFKDKGPLIPIHYSKALLNLCPFCLVLQEESCSGMMIPHSWRVKQYHSVKTARLQRYSQGVLWCQCCDT